MKHPLHMLCRPHDLLLAHALLRGLLVGLLITPSWAAVPAKPVATAVPPLAALQMSVKNWVAQSKKVTIEQVSLAPLDARVKVLACREPLVVDQPFASDETIRVRCSQPVWQQFVRVSVAVKAPVTFVSARTLPPAEPAKRWVLVASMPLQRGMMLNETHVQRAQVDTPVMPVNVLAFLCEAMTFDQRCWSKEVKWFCCRWARRRVFKFPPGWRRCKMDGLVSKSSSKTVIPAGN
jgi:hypothetical protein